ncbi:hypothetical protein ACWIUD_11520 [Helicobacter sp. 23-1044]
MFGAFNSHEVCRHCEILLCKIVAIQDSAIFYLIRRISHEKIHRFCDFAESVAKIAESAKIK